MNRQSTIHRLFGNHEMGNGREQVEEQSSSWWKEQVVQRVLKQIWPEFYVQIDSYVQLVLSATVNAMGFSIHGPRGSGKTLVSKHIGTNYLGQAHVYYFTGLDLEYAYGKFLDSPLKRSLVSIPVGDDKPVLFVIDDADALVVGKKSMEKKLMCCFIEELDTFRYLTRRMLFIVITKEEDQMHLILRRDEYFPHSFCIPLLSNANIRYMVSCLLHQLQDSDISLIVQNMLQRESSLMVPSWNGCVIGHVLYFMSTWIGRLLSYEQQREALDEAVVMNHWQQSLETTFAMTLQKNPTAGINYNRKQSVPSIVDLSFRNDSCLSLVADQLFTVIQYSILPPSSETTTTTTTGGSCFSLFPTSTSPFRGALIYGPCGVGKTSLCYQVIERLGLPVFVLDGASLLTCAIGQSEKTLKQCFIAARRFSPSILFVDQIDMVFPKRDCADGTSAESLSRLTSLFLSEMDGWTTSTFTATIDDATTSSNGGTCRQPEFFVLATAQNVEKIDSALLRPGRLEYKCKLDVPTKQQRYQYVANFWKQVQDAGITVEEEQGIENDSSFMDWVIQQTDGWSLADLSLLFRSVLLIAWKENIRDGEEEKGTNLHLKRRHMETALLTKG